MSNISAFIVVAIVLPIAIISFVNGQIRTVQVVEDCTIGDAGCGTTVISPVVPESEVLIINGVRLVRNVDYSVVYDAGANNDELELTFDLAFSPMPGDELFLTADVYEDLPAEVLVILMALPVIVAATVIYRFIPGVNTRRR